MIILSQRNPEWFDTKIGNTNETVGGKGCLITDHSMITFLIEKYLNPGELAQTLDFTKEAYLIWNSVHKIGLDFVYRFYSRNDEKIKSAFRDPDQYVVLQVNNNHWVWLIGISGGYKVADPYYGDKCYLSKRKYKITGFAVLEKQDEDEWTENDEANTETPEVVILESPKFIELPKDTKFIDISHWNEIEDLSKTKSAGYKGIIHKCTQGISNKDSNYIENKKRIRDLQFCFGAYHFANANDNDATKEAEWFLKNIGEIRSGDILIIDYETYIRDNADDWCTDFADYVKEKTGLPNERIIGYFGNGQVKKYGFKKFASRGYGFWGSRYGLQEQEPNILYKPVMGDFKKMWAWQYCSMGIVPGINERVDLDIIC